MIKVEKITSNQLSYYRTSHNFQAYAEVNTLKEFSEYCQWAEEKNIKLYILGNGSNTLFKRQQINSLILKNNLPKEIEKIADFIISVSSSVLVIEVLKYCYENSWDSFYYLASVPATIGGALAMNAGGSREEGWNIYDFVESVTFLENGEIKTLKNEEILRNYRQTIFTGIHNKLILSAVFKFQVKEFTQNPINQRMQWSKKYQDYSAPNCGSVFKKAYVPLLYRLKGLTIGKSYFSKKTYNWISNKSKSNFYIVLLIKIAVALHVLIGKEADLEIIEVD